MLGKEKQPGFSEIAGLLSRRLVHRDRNRSHCDVDANDGGVFSHEILLSNGRTLSVKFVAFDMLTVSKEDFDISRPDKIAVVAQSGR